MEIPLLLRVAHALIGQNVQIWYLSQISSFFRGFVTQFRAHLSKTCGCWWSQRGMCPTENMSPSTLLRS